MKQRRHVSANWKEYSKGNNEVVSRDSFRRDSEESLRKREQSFKLQCAIGEIERIVVSEEGVEVTKTAAGKFSV